MTNIPETSPGVAPKPVSLRVAVVALVTAALWGGNPVAVSYSVDTLPPIAVAAARFAMASLFMYFWCRFEGCGIGLKRGQLLPVLLVGGGLFVQIATFNIGVTLSDSSHASMLINTYVLWVVLIEHFITRGDRLTGGKLLGVCVAFAGVLLLMVRTSAPATSAKGLDEPTLIGDLILFISAVVLSINVVYMKHVLHTIEPSKLIFWHDLVGTVLFCACSLALERVEPKGLTTTAMLALFYQGIIVAGICFAIQAAMLKNHSASQISIYSFATPLFGVAFGILLRGDEVTPRLFVAAACVALGILFVHASSTKARTTTQDEKDTKDGITDFV